MNHRKTLPALLATVLAVSVCSGAVIATEPTTDILPQTQLLISPAPTPASPETDIPKKDDIPTEPSSTTKPDAEGTVSFGNVAQRVRQGNLTARALGSSISAIEALDYEEMSEDLRTTINNLADTTFFMYSMPGGSIAAASLQAQVESMHDQFKAIKDGELQQDNADTIRMLKHTQNQMAMAGESLYIALIELQQSDATLERNLATLDRGLAELNLRYDMGQVSSLTLQETQSGRHSLVSGQQTLRSNYKILTYQLQAMLGEDLTGELTLAPLPSISAAQLADMDMESDLVQAKQASYTILEAQKKLEDAEDSYKDDANMYTYNPNAGYEKEMAYHQLESAKRTYEASVQNFELSFRTLYHQVKDYQQVLTAAKSTLAVKENSYAAAQIRYEQGVISQFDLLDAQDAVAAAKDTVNSAAIDLFTAYNNYRWAVDYGILN